VRLAIPVFVRMLATCRCTVFRLITSSRAISALLLPAAQTSLSTCRRAAPRRAALRVDSGAKNSVAVAVDRCGIEPFGIELAANPRRRAGTVDARASCADRPAIGSGGASPTYLSGVCTTSPGTRLNSLAL
jgi:hypothetical protein